MSSIFRMRRMRISPAMRALVQETYLCIEDLIQPIFVDEGIAVPTEIASMPGIYRLPENRLSDELHRLKNIGITAVMLFGISRHKDGIGSDTWNPHGLIARMVRIAKQAEPEMLVIPDLCFCEYTDHGHCGVVRHGTVCNDETVENLCKQACCAAAAGADVVAPSGMMDGQVAAIRQALDRGGYSHVSIMAHAAKFGSGLYGPFRAAADCALDGDRKDYQLDPCNVRMALREASLDEAEGADILIVKPAGWYLDVLSRLRERTLLPLTAYQVGGEFSMIRFAARAGALDERRVVIESLTAAKRAGADILVSYFAADVARWLRDFSDPRPRS